MGRGATTSLSAAVATLTLDLHPRIDGFQFDPPVYYPPNIAREDIAKNFPFYAPPPPILPKIIYVPHHISNGPGRKCAYYPEVAEARSEAQSKASAETAAEATAEAVTAEEQIEAAVQVQAARPLPRLKLSNKIYVLGFNTDAKFIAHSLSSVEKLPPVQLLTHNTLTLRKWGEEGRAITVYTQDGIPSTQPIRCPQYIPRRHVPLRQPPIMDNIVVSTVTQAIIPTLFNLRLYIDRRTTLCILHPGLGLMEELNDIVFPNPALRPNYIFCYSNHKLARSTAGKYSIDHIPGNLVCHAVPRDDEAKGLDKWTSDALNQKHTRHMISLLSTSETLNVIGLPWPSFLQLKLQDMIFYSLADTISVMLGCRYDQIRTDRHAMTLWESMLKETLTIVVSLPEFHERPYMLGATGFANTNYPTKLKNRLTRLGTECSKWISMIRRGNMPPVDLINGYFIRRAKELGLSHAHNSFAVELVKARSRGRLRELNNSIPLGLMPYMADTDRIGGGQDKVDPKLDVDADEL